MRADKKLAPPTTPETAAPSYGVSKAGIETISREVVATSGGPVEIHKMGLRRVPLTLPRVRWLEREVSDES